MRLFVVAEQIQMNDGQAASRIHDGAVDGQLPHQDDDTTRAGIIISSCQYSRKETPRKKIDDGQAEFDQQQRDNSQRAVESKTWPRAADARAAPF